MTDENKEDEGAEYETTEIIVPKDTENLEKKPNTDSFGTLEENIDEDGNINP